MEARPPIARRQQIEQLVDELAGRIGHEQPLDLAAVGQQHLELMPELGEHLKVLEGIQRAAQRVRDEGPGPGLDDFAADKAFFEKELPNYEFIERLRSGGQGVVYRAVQRSTDRVVALKLLVDNLLTSPRQQQRFLREVRLSARLRHPNIVSIYEASIVGRRPLYAMEYVDGCAFDDYVLLHGLDARQAVALTVKICHAVHAAHQRGIIHRDLKPSNILVDEQGEPKVLDFGLAKSISGDGDSDEDLSLAGRVIGTLPYLSPEQAVADEGQIDVRSDVYALGVLLYQALTGQFPYPVQGPTHQVLANIAVREPVPLRKALRCRPGPGFATARGVNDDLEKVLAKALAKSPKDRYQSVEALAADLERFCRGEAVEAKAHYRLYQLRKAVRRFRVPLAVAAAFIVVLFLSQWAVFRAEQRRQHDAQQAKLGLEMGGVVRLGASYQNSGDLQNAVPLFEWALEVSPEDPQADSVSSFRFFALHRLAAMYYEHNRPDDARPYTVQAEQLANRLAERDPQNPQWRRLQSFVAVLRGREAMAEKDWQRAVEVLSSAIDGFRRLLSEYGDNDSVQIELANALGTRGSCYSILKRHELGLADLDEAVPMVLQLHQRDPQVLHHAIDLARLEGRYGVIYMRYKTPEADQAAMRYFESAEQRLRELQARPESEGRAWTIRSLLGPIHENKKKLERRFARDS